MTQFEYIVTDPQGFHVRSASYLAKAISKYSCEVCLQKDGQSANARHVFEALNLVIKQGDKIVLTFEGEGEREASEELKIKIKEFL